LRSAVREWPLPANRDIFCPTHGTLGKVTSGTVALVIDRGQQHVFDNADILLVKASNGRISGQDFKTAVEDLNQQFSGRSEIGADELGAMGYILLHQTHTVNGALVTPTGLKFWETSQGNPPGGYAVGPAFSLDKLVKTASGIEAVWHTPR